MLFISLPENGLSSTCYSVQFSMSDPTIASYVCLSLCSWSTLLSSTGMKVPHGQAFVFFLIVECHHLEEVQSGSWEKVDTRTLLGTDE